MLIAVLIEGRGSSSSSVIATERWLHWIGSSVNRESPVHRVLAPLFDGVTELALLDCATSVSKLVTRTAAP